MAKSKKQKQEEALARLTTNVAERMSTGCDITFAHRSEYNSLKKSLGYSGRI